MIDFLKPLCSITAQCLGNVVTEWPCRICLRPNGKAFFSLQEGWVKDEPVEIFTDPGRNQCGNSVNENPCPGIIFK